MTLARGGMLVLGLWFFSMGLGVGQYCVSRVIWTRYEFY